MSGQSVFNGYATATVTGPFFDQKVREKVHFFNGYDLGRPFLPKSALFFIWPRHWPKSTKSAKFWPKMRTFCTLFYLIFEM